MHLPKISALITALCLALPTTAQGKVQVFGHDGMRATSTIVLFGADLMAGITVTHGQPEWRDEYTDMIGKLKGKTNRLGKDMWTTFLNSIPVSIGGVTIPAGSYVVGLHCDKSGSFALAMLDATKAMKAGQMPFGPQKWKADVMVPLKFNKNVSKKNADKMLMTIASNKEDPMTGTFTLAWGPHTLTGALKIKPAAKTKAKAHDHGHDHK